MIAAKPRVLRPRRRMRFSCLSRTRAKGRPRSGQGIGIPGEEAERPEALGSRSNWEVGLSRIASGRGFGFACPPPTPVGREMAWRKIFGLKIGRMVSDGDVA